MSTIQSATTNLMRAEHNHAARARVQHRTAGHDGRQNDASLERVQVERRKRAGQRQQIDEAALQICQRQTRAPVEVVHADDLVRARRRSRARRGRGRSDHRRGSSRTRRLVRAFEGEAGGLDGRSGLELGELLPGQRSARSHRRRTSARLRRSYAGSQSSPSSAVRLGATTASESRSVG